MNEHETNAELQPPIPGAPAECLIELASLRWQSPATGLRVKEVCRGSQRLRLIEFSEAFVEADWCRAGHIGYVIDGTLEIDFNGKPVRFHAGDGLWIPEGEHSQHKANVPKGKVILFVVEQSE